jgi:hypothetical protein
MPEPNSIMLLGSGIGGAQSGLGTQPPPLQPQVPVSVNASDGIEPKVFS